jgi:hypothetical protein
MGAWTGLAGTDFSAGEACFEEKQPILLIIVEVFRALRKAGSCDGLCGDRNGAAMSPVSWVRAGDWRNG